MTTDVSGSNRVSKKYYAHYCKQCSKNEKKTTNVENRKTRF